jgi:hypothetical protein
VGPLAETLSGYCLGTAFAIIACTSLIAVAMMTEAPKRFLDGVFLEAFDKAAFDPVRT